MKIEKDYIFSIVGSTIESYAAAVDVSGNIMSIKKGDGLNILETQRDKFFSNLHRLLNELNNSVLNRYNRDLEYKHCKMVSIAVEGVHSEYHMRFISDCIKNTFWKKDPLIIARGKAALVAGLLSSNGIAIKAGTGAFVYGQKDDKNAIVPNYLTYIAKACNSAHCQPFFAFSGHMHRY